MTPRQQRQTRKRWKENSLNYRLKQKRIATETSMLRENTPPQSSDEENVGNYRECRKDIGKRIAARNKVKRHREKKSMAKKMKEMKRKLDSYKKKYYRIRKKLQSRKKLDSTNPNLTPATKVEAMLNESHIDPSKVAEVKKSLFFGEVVKKQLSESYKTLKTDRTKQVFKKILNGKVIKKYRLKTELSTAMKFRRTPKYLNKDITTFERKSGKRKEIADMIRKKIQAFLELEVNSRVCPGKKEFVTKNKRTEQKRFLTNTLKNLYQEYLRMYPQLKVSYKFFCLARPFYIQPMKVADRETCKCVTHSNIELIVQSLYLNDILYQKTPADVLKNICCNYRNESCLLRECNGCKSSSPHFKEYNRTEFISYFQWVNLKQNYFDKKSKQVKQIRKIAKQLQEVSKTELVTIFEKKFKLFMDHEARIVHQHNTITQLKKDLQPSEILIHCDFSENYSLKYAEETQSFHFGGARQQITLHTVVVYSKVEMETKPKSFCTLSESLQHGAAAIWAHLNPILEYYCDKGVDAIHFLSDSPATQYRNKHMFYFFASQLMKLFPQLKRVTWNYHEAGHGKGAPDGVGGVCKRTADRTVAQGKDIPDFKVLFEILEYACPGITFFAISSQDIDRFATLLNSGTPLSFHGTMKVHQVITEGGKLWLRSLSCFSCKKYCKHFDLGTISYKSSPSKETLTNTQLSSKVKFSDVYSDSDDEPSESCCSKSNNLVKNGVYVLVSVSSQQGTKKQSIKSYRYVAVCQSDFDEDDGEIKVAFLKLCDQEKGAVFKFDDENDVSYIKENQILEVLPEPELIIKGHRVYYKFPRLVDVFERA